MKYLAYYENDQILSLVIEGTEADQLKLQRCADVNLGVLNIMNAQLVEPPYLIPVYELRVIDINQMKLDQLSHLGLTDVPLMDVLIQSAPLLPKLSVQSLPPILEEKTQDMPIVETSAVALIPKNILLLIGQGIHDHFIGNSPRVDVIGNEEDGFSLENIPNKHYDTVILYAHGGRVFMNTPEDTHLVQLQKRDGGKTIDIILQIMQLTTPKILHLVSCRAGYIGKHLKQQLAAVTSIMSEGNMKHVTISIAASSNSYTQRPFSEDYIEAVASIDESETAWLQTASIMHHRLPETLKQYHFYHDPKSNQIKMAAFKIHAPKVISEFKDPTQFIGSHALYGAKIDDKAARQRAQLITEIGDEQDEFYITLRNQLLKEFSRGEKRFTKEYIQNAMFLFITRNKPALVLECIEQGADVNFNYRGGFNGLHIADTLTMVELLIGKNANIHAGNDEQSTPLHIAASNGRTQIAETLVRHGAFINAVNNLGSTALHVAANYNESEVIDKLIELGADIFALTTGKNTVLWEAASSGSLSIVEKLIALKINVNTANAFGTTALHVASQNGHIKVVQALIQAGAQVNVFNEKGGFPLFFASQNGHLPNVEELLLNGANVNATDHGGVTSLHVTAQNGHTAVLLKLLSVKGINLHAVHNSSGFTALHFAAFNNNIEEVKLLLRHGANPTLATKAGSKPMALTNNEEIKKLLTDAEQVFTAMALFQRKMPVTTAKEMEQAMLAIRHGFFSLPCGLAMSAMKIINAKPQKKISLFRGQGISRKFDLDSLNVDNKHIMWDRAEFLKLSSTQDISPSGIPNYIHLIWMGSFLRAAHQDRIIQWQHLNPHHQVILWINRQMIDEIIFQKFHTFCVAHNILLCDLKEIHSSMAKTTASWIEELCTNEHRNYGAISDLYRFYVLKELGGWYFDTDVSPLHPLPRDLLLNYGFAVNLEHDTKKVMNTTPAVLVSNKNSLFLTVCIEIVNRFASHLAESIESAIHHSDALIRVVSTQSLTGSIVNAACSKLYINGHPFFHQYDNEGARIDDYELLKKISLTCLGFDKIFNIGNEQSWFMNENNNELLQGLYNVEGLIQEGEARKKHLHIRQSKVCSDVSNRYMDLLFNVPIINISSSGPYVFSNFEHVDLFEESYVAFCMKNSRKEINIAQSEFILFNSNREQLLTFSVENKADKSYPNGRMVKKVKQCFEPGSEIPSYALKTLHNNLFPSSGDELHISMRDAYCNKLLGRIGFAFRYNSKQYILSSWLPGMTLAKIPPQKIIEIPLSQRLILTLHLLKEIAILHHHGIYHNDIQPAHVMLDNDKFYLFDFKAARLENEPLSENAVITTPLYIDPQTHTDTKKDPNCLYKKLNSKSDIYALGATLIFLFPEILSYITFENGSVVLEQEELYHLHQSLGELLTSLMEPAEKRPDSIDRVFLEFLTVIKTQYPTQKIPELLMQPIEPQLILQQKKLGSDAFAKMRCELLSYNRLVGIASGNTRKILKKPHESALSEFSIFPPPETSAPQGSNNQSCVLQ